MATITTIEQFVGLFGYQTKEEYIANLEADLELFKARGLEKSVAVISAELDRMKASN